MTRFGKLGVTPLPHPRARASPPPGMSSEQDELSLCLWPLQCLHNHVNERTDPDVSTIYNIVSIVEKSNSAMLLMRISTSSCTR